MVTGDETGLASQLISTPPLPTQPLKGCTTPPGSMTPTLYEQQCGYFSRTFQRLVFTSDGVEVGSRMRSRKSAYDLVKIKNRSRKRCHKRDGIAVRRIRTFPFSFDSAYDSVAYVLHMI